MKNWKAILALLLLTGCAGLNRSCSSIGASALGSDWLIVQYATDGTPINCWQLRNVSVGNEHQSDGIFWVDNTTGHLVHISGWYNRVQVSSNGFEGAAKLVGVDLARCVNGKYAR